MLAQLLIKFYSLWHGHFHFKGAGFLLKQALPLSPTLSHCPLILPQGQTVTVDFNDVAAFYWLNHLLGDRFEEEGLLRALRGFVKPGSVIWDVGANCGLFSYVLTQKTAASKVIFFEPNPALFRIAEEALEPFQSARGFPYALSDHEGTSLLTVPHGGSTMATLEARRTNRSGIEFEIQCRTGDQLIAAGLLDPPHIIKVDTEGHEAAVLQGLERTIQAHQPIIFVEHISLTDSELTAMCPANYTICAVSDEDGSLTARPDRTKGHNSAFIPTSVWLQDGIHSSQL